MQKLFDIKKTQLEMVRDRGYDIYPDELAILNMTLREFTAYVNALKQANPKLTIRAVLTRLYTARLPTGEEKSMLVYFGGKTDSQQKQVPAATVRNFIGSIQQYRATESVFIVDAPLSSKGDTELKALTTTKWQIFQDGDLTYNPTTHVDTPRHELLSPEETQEKLVELKADLTKLLLIKVTDPVIRYYGWSVGGLVRVYRNDQSISVLSPESINYRVIVG